MAFCFFGGSMFKAHVCILAFVLLSGCGGGGSSPPEVAVVPPPAPPPTPSPPPPVGVSCPSQQSGVDLVPGTVEASVCSQATAPVTLTYANGASHQLDLFRPSGLAGPFPTVIWIHGGGWRTGSRINDEQAKRLVCRGYAVASIDYRLSDVATFPAQIHDVKAAIRYLRANAATLNLDGARFATFGSSAGGHLAALAATSAGVASLEDFSQGNATTSSAVQAGASWYGPTDLSLMDSQLQAQSCPVGSINHSRADSAESLFLGCQVGTVGCAATVDRANPATYVGANSPPMLLFHGTADCTVPRAQSDVLKSAFDNARRCAIRRNVVGAGHGGVEWVSAPPQDAVANFFDAVLKP